MRVGVVLGADQSRFPALARRAEELGFDQVACGEHLFFHGPTPNSFVGLAAAAGATDRIRLLSSLALVPLYPAALLAKLVSSLDQVSGGRFDFGVGVGGEYPPEFTAAGVEVHQRGARTDEALELLPSLLAGKTVHHSGRFADIPGLALRPPAVQPRVPVWVGGRRKAAQRRAGRFGDVWMPYLCTPEQLAAGLATADAEAVACGRPPGSVRGAVFAWGAVGRDGARARQRAIEVVSRVYQQDFAPLAEDYLVAGGVDGVLDRLRQYADAGCEHLVFCPAGGATEWDEMAELFAAEVLPVVRDAQEGVNRMGSS
jgi:alkanesulfonate monooxygenase SsuD/methylene tetrahydromethanopterin reductase-like flavin-dependent oxidoreductase (luciferase family)